jgi:hypothetical protein
MRPFFRNSGKNELSKSEVSRCLRYKTSNVCLVQKVAGKSLESGVHFLWSGGPHPPLHKNFFARSKATIRQLPLACCSPHLAALGRCFALTTGLRIFIMSATARLGENTVLLHFAVKLLEGKLKGVAGVNSDLTHSATSAIHDH